MEKHATYLVLVWKNANIHSSCQGKMPTYPVLVWKNTIISSVCLKNCIVSKDCLKNVKISIVCLKKMPIYLLIVWNTHFSIKPTNSHLFHAETCISCMVAFHNVKSACHSFISGVSYRGCTSWTLWGQRDFEIFYRCRQSLTANYAEIMLFDE